MTSDNLSALIARLEAATEGSGDLTADIYQALGYEVVRAGRGGRKIAWRYMGIGAFGYEPRWVSMQNLTTSIDAALTLLPEGWQRTINDADNMQDCIVELFHDPTDAEVTVRGKTWPLTICIAALKARTTAPTGEHTTT